MEPETKEPTLAPTEIPENQYPYNLNLKEELILSGIIVIGACALSYMLSRCTTIE